MSKIIKLIFLTPFILFMIAYLVIDLTIRFICFDLQYFDQKEYASFLYKGTEDIQNISSFMMWLIIIVYIL